MPSSKNYKRNYQQENKYKAQPEQIKARVARNKARQEALGYWLATLPRPRNGTENVYYRAGAE